MQGCGGGAFDIHHGTLWGGKKRNRNGVKMWVNPFFLPPGPLRAEQESHSWPSPFFMTVVTPLFQKEAWTLAPVLFTLTLVGTPCGRSVVRPVFGRRAMEGRDMTVITEAAVHALECPGFPNFKGQGLEAISPLRGGWDSGRIIQWALP